MRIDSVLTWFQFGFNLVSIWYQFDSNQITVYSNWINWLQLLATRSQDQIFGRKSSSPNLGTYQYCLIVSIWYFPMDSHQIDTIRWILFKLARSILKLLNINEDKKLTALKMACLSLSQTVVVWSSLWSERAGDSHLISKSLGWNS